MFEHLLPCSSHNIRRGGARWVARVRVAEDRGLQSGSVRRNLKRRRREVEKRNKVKRGERIMISTLNLWGLHGRTACIAVRQRLRLAKSACSHETAVETAPLCVNG